jgi:hypothetical protein
VVDSYEAPDPEFAAMVYETDRESDKQLERLRHASSAELKQVLREKAESTVARGTALLGLMGRHDPELKDLILELFDDPDQELWRMACCGGSRKDPRIHQKLRDKLADPDEWNWSHAAVELARAGDIDQDLLPQFKHWLEHGDEPHRNVAVECLKYLNSTDSRVVLEDYWESGDGDEETRMIIAAALLESGNPCGRNLLETVATSGVGHSSVFAATSIYFTRPLDGLNLMRKILDEGDLEAKQAMVQQIWNLAHLPRAFTADGLSEARVWVTQEVLSVRT